MRPNQSANRRHDRGGGETPHVHPGRYNACELAADIRRERPGQHTGESRKAESKADEQHHEPRCVDLQAYEHEEGCHGEADHHGDISRGVERIATAVDRIRQPSDRYRRDEDEDPGHRSRVAHGRQAHVEMLLEEEGQPVEKELYDVERAEKRQADAPERARCEEPRPGDLATNDAGIEAGLDIRPFGVVDLRVYRGIVTRQQEPAQRSDHAQAAADQEHSPQAQCLQDPNCKGRRDNRGAIGAGSLDAVNDAPLSHRKPVQVELVQRREKRRFREAETGPDKEQR